MALDNPDLHCISLSRATQHYRSIQARYGIGIRRAIIMHEQFVITALHDNGLAPYHFQVLILNILKSERPESRDWSLVRTYNCVHLSRGTNWVYARGYGVSVSVIFCFGKVLETRKDQTLYGHLRRPEYAQTLHKQEYVPWTNVGC